jgi:glycosyltransferase involved in cell wall biosynthesis
MCEQFLKANVYVNPSCIENSPNSVCEAQLLGVPCVASNVGGTDDLITNGVNGYLYRFEEDEILALRIIDFFSDLDNTRRISNNARELALVRHNKINNTKNILSIYNDILND